MLYKMRSKFGHEVAICCEAARKGEQIVILPKAENAEQHYAAAYDILYVMSFFYPKQNFIVPSFEDREKYEAIGVDWVEDLRAEKFNQEYWNAFASHKLTPTRENDREFSVSEDAIMWIPQKFQTDGLCKVSAEQQSLFPEFFWFMKSKEKAFFQHFHKVNDKPLVEEMLKNNQPCYVPGEKENPELFGLRGVPHEKYLNLYKKVKGCVGVAGTHTWILLTMFPEKPQIILYNKAGVEKWDEIEKAYQAQGYPIYCRGFEDSTDKEAFSLDIAELFVNVFK